MPSTATDRLNGLTTSVAVKAPCRVATTAAITLSGLQTIDGVALAAGDRVLVKDQASAIDNGIWIAGSGAWTRAPDFNGSLDVVGGTMILIVRGTTNANSYWRADSVGALTPSVDSLTFSAAFVDDSATATFLQAGTGAVPRTVQDRLRGVVELRDFGADPTGVTNSATALTNAINYCISAGYDLDLGAGTFLINSTVTITGDVGLVIRGRGLTNTILKKTTSGNMLVLNGVSRFSLTDCGFNGEDMTTGGGIVVQGAGVGVVRIDRNQFAGFPGRGLYFNGTAITAESSSNFVTDNLFLSCGIGDGTPQAEYRYANDTKFRGNQYGVLDLADHPTIGAYYYGCGASNWDDDFHWENLVGAKYESCAYGRWKGMRWETNQRQGAIFITCIKGTMGVVTAHTNSMEGDGLYNYIDFVTCGIWTISALDTFEWTGGVLNGDYAISYDTTCNEMRFVGCSFKGWSTAPVSRAFDAFDVRFLGCLPRQKGLDETAGVGITCHKVTVAGGQTRFSGPYGSGSSTPGTYRGVAVDDCVIDRIASILDTAPGGSETCVTTLFVDDVATALSVTVTGASFGERSPGSLANIIPINAGQAWELRTVKSAGAASGDVASSIRTGG